MEYGGKIREGKKWSKKEKEKMKYVWSWILGVKYKNCDSIDTCFNCDNKLKKWYDTEDVMWNWMYVDTIYKIMCDGCKKNIKNININGYKINIG